MTEENATTEPRAVTTVKLGKGSRWFKTADWPGPDFPRQGSANMAAFIKSFQGAELQPGDREIEPGTCILEHRAVPPRPRKKTGGYLMYIIWYVIPPNGTGYTRYSIGQSADMTSLVNDYVDHGPTGRALHGLRTTIKQSLNRMDYLRASIASQTSEIEALERETENSRELVSAIEGDAR